MSPSTPPLTKAQRCEKFQAVFAIIRDDILSHFTKEGMPKDAIEWYRHNLEYNVPGGKLNRGLSVVDTAEIIYQRPLTDDEYFQAAVLGWCVELLQAYFLIADDIMDHSLTRRGKPCWYLQPHVGMIAINDSFMLYSAIYYLLKRYIKPAKGDKDARVTLETYIDIVDLFHETTYQTEMGQAVDLLTAPEGDVDLKRFSLEKHSVIVQYKTAYYSFYLPVALAMHLCGIPAGTPGQDAYATAMSILLPLGTYFQVQDDFLDFSMPAELLGKVGTDIIDNKCSWVVNIVYARANDAQKAILDANYGRGKSGGEEETRVREVFEAVGLRQAYVEYEETVVEELKARIAKVHETKDGLRREVFTSFLDKIYGRSK